MPFKHSYLQAVVKYLQPGTYGNEQDAIRRIRSLYSTARQGNLSTDIGTYLWKNFFVLVRQQVFDVSRNQFALPAPQPNYDKFAIDQMCTLAMLLRKHGLPRRHKGNPFGIAQKMFNLFMKDQWALDLIPPESEPLLHVPLDSTVLRQLRNPPPPKTWESWTRAEDNQQTRSDYLTVQQRFRDLAREKHLVSPMELEQTMWQQCQNGS
jgi:hypothetical protein